MLSTDELRITRRPTRRLRSALVLVVMVASGCAVVTADDEAARLAAEDAVTAVLLVDTKAVFGDTLWLQPELDAALSRPAEVDEAAWIAHWREELAGVPRSLREIYIAAQRNERRLSQLPAITARAERCPVRGPAGIKPLERSYRRSQLSLRVLRFNEDKRLGMPRAALRPPSKPVHPR